MSVEVRPLGVKCNIQCQYCYQNPQRDAGNVLHSYDMDRMKSAINQEGGPFTLFGGEPLLMPERDLEDLWAWGFAKFGSNSVQTNGSLINDNHIRMFKQYHVYVGISVDGPGQLNDARWAGTLERTTDATEKTQEAIARLCREGIPPSLIVTLHRNNATADKLPLMHAWMRELERLGVTSMRLHILESESQEIREKYSLTTDENLAAFLSFATLEEELTTLQFDVFYEMRHLLMGDDTKASCVWGACDSYTTAAVRGIEGSGQSSNCGRTNKDGIDFAKAATEGFERYVALYQTPQEHDGCQGCRFFLMCKGQCPGTAIDGDWRNRTEHCQVWKGLFRHFEGELLDQDQYPLTVNPIRKRVEQALLERWSAGENLPVSYALEVLTSRSGASISDATRSEAVEHGDEAHGDAEHGDSPHGDAVHADM